MSSVFPETDPAPKPGMVMADEGARGATAPAPVSEDLKRLGDELLTTLQKPEMVTRRIEVRDTRERREFWNGNHWIYWSEQYQTWRRPDSVDPTRGEESDQDVPIAHYVNDYLFYGLDAISIIASNHAATKFYPGNPKSPEDVTASDGASDYVRYFRRQNRDEWLRVKQSYFLYNDGAFFNYIRPVADGRKFGTKQQPILAPMSQKMGQDAYSCGKCGGMTSAATAMGACENCGNGINESNFTPAPSVMLPIQVGQQEYPNMEIVLDTFGKLETRVSPGGETIYDLSYLDTSLEVHRSALRAMYPENAEKIGMGNSGGSTDTTFEVNARRVLGQGTGTPSLGVVDQLVTYKRAWVAPWAYYELTPEKTKQLQEAFPDGYMIVKADDVVCDMRGENLTRRWRMCKALPSTGQNGPSIGSSQLPIQKATNDILNQNIDAAANSISSLFVDREVVDLDAWASTMLQPGVAYPAVPKPGQPLESSFFATPSTSTSAEAVRLYEYLSQYASQRATGVTPSVQGMQTGGAGDTASGYENMRQQSMKRLSLPWRAMRFCNEETDLLAFELFRETAVDNLSFVEPDESGETQMHEIHVDDLKGEVKIIHDTSEDIPSSPVEERATLMQLITLAAKNPAITAILSNPATFPYLKSRLGLKDIIFPTEYARTHQRVEIEKLLGQQPQMGMSPNGQSIPVASSILPNPAPGLEDDESHMAEIRDWWESPEGRHASETNQTGTANVILHYEAHQQRQQQMAIAAAAQNAGSNVVPFHQAPAVGGGNQ